MAGPRMPFVEDPMLDLHMLLTLISMSDKAAQKEREKEAKKIEMMLDQMIFLSILNDLFHDINNIIAAVHANEKDEPLLGFLTSVLREDTDEEDTLSADYSTDADEDCTQSSNSSNSSNSSDTDEDYIQLTDSTDEDATWSADSDEEDTLSADAELAKNTEIASKEVNDAAKLCQLSPSFARSLHTIYGGRAREYARAQKGNEKAAEAAVEHELRSSFGA